MRGVNLIQDTVCKSQWCRQILSRLRADLRENPTKRWASSDALIQSAGSISKSARYRSDANIALGPILKMYIPGQIRIFNALNYDGYSTGNAPPSGNNERYAAVAKHIWTVQTKTWLPIHLISSTMVLDAERKLFHLIKWKMACSSFDVIVFNRCPCSSWIRLLLSQTWRKTFWWYLV